MNLDSFQEWQKTQILIKSLLATSEHKQKIAFFECGIVLMRIVKRAQGQMQSHWSFHQIVFHLVYRIRLDEVLKIHILAGTFTFQKLVSYTHSFKNVFIWLTFCF